LEQGDYYLSPIEGGGSWLKAEAHGLGFIAFCGSFLGIYPAFSHGAIMSKPQTSAIENTKKFIRRLLAAGGRDEAYLLHGIELGLQLAREPESKDFARRFPEISRAAIERWGRHGAVGNVYRDYVLLECENFGLFDDNPLPEFGDKVISIESRRKGVSHAKVL
jgi:hypothetical protein